MLVSQKRPRVLNWYHAGPLLFGDWGTSRLYVLGLAFAFTGFAAPYYLIALSLLMVAVAWAYTIVCRSFPEGGGVYQSARAMHPLLGVIGATLLIADYMITASISSMEAFHYFGVPEGAGGWNIFLCCLATIAVLGVVNWFGPRAAGRLALFVAVLALVLSAVVGLAALPFVPRGLRSMEWGSAPLGERWVHFVSIILALSGVEAVANMTGVMKEPVARTSKRTIWPVLGEVATLNVLFGVALVGVVGAGLAGAIANFSPNDPKTHDLIEHAAMKVLAIESGQYWFGETVGWWFGKAAAVVFGLLLISAANTVLVGMASVMYALGRDRELPRPLTRLNYSGVPSVPLIIACAAPVLVLFFVRDLKSLAGLYAIGVCGAIALDLTCVALNRTLRTSRTERAGLWAVAVFMAVVWVSIAWTKPVALAFAGGLVLLSLLGRWTAHRVAPPEATLPEPAHGWLAVLQGEPLELDPSRPRIMLAARGRYQAEFAVDMARRRNATLFAIYVRTLRVVEMAATAPRIEEDPAAQESLGTVALLARQYRVPFVPVYVRSPDIADEILDYTVTYGCDTLIMGKTGRRAFARAIEGDVISQVARHLPNEVALITRDPSPHPMPAPPADPEARAGPDAPGNGTASHALRSAPAGTEPGDSTGHA